VILVKKDGILDFGGSFGNFWIDFGEMEKTIKIFFFKTFFLNSKMDKNKCPIFIFKKEFQTMKIVFF
jgi:hypothetical protein